MTPLQSKTAYIVIPFFSSKVYICILDNYFLHPCYRYKKPCGRILDYVACLPKGWILRCFSVGCWSICTLVLILPPLFSSIWTSGPLLACRFSAILSCIVTRAPELEHSSGNVYILQMNCVNKNKWTYC